VSVGTSDQRRGLFDDLEDELVEDQSPVESEPVPSQEEESSVPEADLTPVPETSSTFDLNSPDGVAKALEQSEALRNYLEKVRLDTANIERQRYQKQVQQEQGASDRAAAYHQSIVDRLIAGEDPNVIKKEIPLYVTANEGWVRANFMKEMIDRSMQEVSESDRKHLEDLASEVDSPESFQRFADRAFDYAMNSSNSKFLANLDFESLKEHPKFGDWITQQVKDKMEEEMSAQKKQASVRQNAPKVPSGAAPTGTINVEQYLAMDEKSRQNYLTNLSEEQEDALMTALYESARGISS
jgi:hypothetical protein